MNENIEIAELQAQLDECQRVISAQAETIAAAHKDVAILRSHNELMSLRAKKAEDGLAEFKAEVIKREARAEIDRLRANDRAADPLDLIKNPLTPYGLLVRALRIAAGTTLMEMSRFCGQAPSYMSGVETGRKPLSAELICFTHRFFHDKGLNVTLLLLQQAADARRRIEGESKP